MLTMSHATHSLVTSVDPTGARLDFETPPPVMEIEKSPDHSGVPVQFNRLSEGKQLRDGGPVVAST